MAHRFLSALLLSITILALVTGCAGQQTRTRSSVVDYLYPGQRDQTIKPSIPNLNIPINVGIAFVPGEYTTSKGFSLWSRRVNRGGNFSESKKTALLDKVAAHFRKYEFVKEIEVIPSAYLTPEGSFTNLEQIKTMYGVDIVALVSFDQIQFTDEGMLSLTYWTLVGAYVVSGEKNDTNTLMDTAVYDISSKKMLFRAPGTSRVKGKSTPVNLSEELRADSEEGFKKSLDNMIVNLDTQLDRFKDKIKERPEVAMVTYEPSYRGGGGGLFGGVELLLFLTLALLRHRRASLKFI